MAESGTKMTGIVVLGIVVILLSLQGTCTSIQRRQAETLIEMGKQGLCARPGTSNEGTLLNVYFEKCVERRAQ